MEAFVGTFFIYAKCALLLLTFMAETRVAVYYLILNIVLFITCTQQEYQGPNKVQYLKGYDFDALVEKDTSDKMWLVEFYTTWADDCVQFSSLYSHLSLKYATPSYVFAKVDIGFNGEIAKKYQIDVSTSSKQLPTLMLFQRGIPCPFLSPFFFRFLHVFLLPAPSLRFFSKNICVMLLVLWLSVCPGKPISQYRLPPLRADGSVHRCVMNEEIIARFFELETMTMSKAGGAPAAGDVNTAPVTKKAEEKQANNKKSI